MYSCILTLITVCPLISHITLGFGYPVTRQQNRALPPSVVLTASGFVTKQGLNFSVSVSKSSGARCQPDSISRILSMDIMPFGSCDSYTIPVLPEHLMIALVSSVP